MKHYQSWKGCAIVDGKQGEYFCVSVPGNIQKDYADYMGWGDVGYMNNFEKYGATEDYFWSYRTELCFERREGERVYFVTHGIEYQYDVILDGEKLLYHEGMFSRVEIDLTDRARCGSVLEILIYPHPKREGAPAAREQADQSCKPAVAYSWDWHPRLLVSGIWDETYIETRDASYVGEVEASYVLSEDMSRANVHFDVECEGEFTVTLWDADGKAVYCGTGTDFSVDNPQLWWCNGYGEPYLYSWEVKCGDSAKRGRLGFRRVRIVMAEGQWDKFIAFPKGRNDAPITLELNGVHIFAKGSNWVNPEIFTATITKEKYYEQVLLAKQANMNIFRCWGGAIINKEAFFDACDEYGIMVWQEFPLACNNYKGTPAYLRVLEQEARAIVRRVRKHACHVMWCGGNELFNNWSRMTDQSHALRLLDKVSYEEDFAKPFIKTSPIIGMSHGGYFFYEESSGKSVFEIYRNSNSTAYTEFGCPSMASYEQLSLIFDEQTLHNPSVAPDSPWVTHHCFRAWQINSWGYFNVVDMYFGKQNSVKDYVAKSQLLQCEGYKCIFEEARRQKPACSMAINWDYNEPWRTAAGNNLLEYPSTPKSAYYAVKDALRPIMPSARVEHFDYKPGDVLNAELWLLNDTLECAEDEIEVYFTVDGNKKHVITWSTGLSEKGKNICGHTISIKVPDSVDQLMLLTLVGRKSGVSEYKFLLDNKPITEEIFIPQLNN